MLFVQHTLRKDYLQPRHTPISTTLPLHVHMRTFFFFLKSIPAFLFSHVLFLATP